MNGVPDDTPRMTAADADARFAALVAQHRAEKKGKPSGNTGKFADKTAAIGLALVYCLGVTAGALCHAKPSIAIVAGAPLVFFACLLIKRSRARIDAS